MNAVHDVLAPFGPQAAHVRTLWELTLVVCTLVFAAILAALVFALWRAPRSSPQSPPDVSSLERPEAGKRRTVVAAVTVSTLLLLGLVGASFFTDRALARLSTEDALRLEVTAHQWWWEVRYVEPQVADSFITANEIHVPTGRPVIVTLKADDVIHSFWVPSLSGKKDLIPGRTSTLQFRADRDGVYRGQCAEFCGFQHALMAFFVVADPPERYAAWADAQRRTAGDPPAGEALRGRSLFMNSSCAMCHAIDGTSAQATRGPNLTHVAGRGTLAAGALANTPQDLKRWISDPQQIKPGTNMPATALSREDMDALVSYLQTLR
ncbi:Cytochrome c oxidase subunit 2 precursor [Variovorax sp. PBS-H4]|nr:cytochrome c oxidase subunit II [Variovorax sp. PBS-H4]VTU41153.1 Cytochrome c oxidase subunit 2 precursor [Variovorax sp. PBS-H4]